MGFATQQKRLTALAIIAILIEKVGVEFLQKQYNASQVEVEEYF